MFWVHMGSDVFGGELFGPYDSLDEAGAAVGRLAVSAFRTTGRNKMEEAQRSFTILEAKSKEKAEAQVAATAE